MGRMSFTQELKELAEASEVMGAGTKREASGLHDRPILVLQNPAGQSPKPVRTGQSVTVKFHRSSSFGLMGLSTPQPPWRPDVAIGESA
jgi:hypothetical protein